MSDCEICFGEGWVCENHPSKAWKDGDGCCGGAGAPCKCNESVPPWHHVNPLDAPLMESGEF